MEIVKPRGWTAKDWVRQQSNRNLGWTQCVAEWIDNSIGNGATRITVSWMPSLVEIKDNGLGCTPRMFAALVSPGWHEENEDTENRVSRYGIGAKDGFTWCQGQTEVFSQRDGAHLFIEVDWQSFEDEFDFDMPQDGEYARRKCLSVGLQTNGVVIRQHHRRQIHIKSFGLIHSALSRLYWAAVETGVEIDVRFYPHGQKKKHHGGLLSGKPMPTFSEGSQIAEELKLADGRNIRIDGGILDPSIRWSDPGFEYIYGHRVVLPACGTGAGGLDFERCYFRVFLIGEKTDWQVTTNKDSLHDEDIAALGQAVFDRCKATLERSASGDYASMIDQELLNELAGSLTEAHRKKAKRRSAVNESGTVKGTGKGGKHTNAANTGDDDGECRKRGGATPISIRKAEFADDEAHLLGKALVRDKLVRLNTRHPYIDRAFANRDRDSLYVVATFLWSYAWIFTDENGQNRHLPRSGSSFADKSSAMLTAWVGGQPQESEA